MGSEPAAEDATGEIVIFTSNKGIVSLVVWVGNGGRDGGGSEN